MKDMILEGNNILDVWLNFQYLCNFRLGCRAAEDQEYVRR